MPANGWQLMTEAEWLACDEPGSKVFALHERHLRRKHLLCLCACYRLLYPAHPDGARATELLECYADGEADFQEVVRLKAELGQPGAPAWPLFDNGIGLTADFWGSEFGQFHAAWQTGSAVAGSATTRKPGRPSKAAAAERERRRAATLALVRCVFGNPFRPVHFPNEWRTATATALARTMYDSRDFSAMPILGDALQEADCGNEEILAHCRDGGSHVRGCWVVDLILKKG
jgi:hypothetical protein